MNNIKLARNILEVANNVTDSDNQDYTFRELVELMQGIKNKIEEGETDFYLDELACGEVRVVCKSVIGETWHEELIQTVKDCYDFAETLENLPSCVACDIDWDQTAENCKVDGMGHHFAGYDHEEHSTNTHYIFRTS